MGVGKTIVCQCLKNNLNNSVFLDGDWCWDANPFQVTEETKTMVMKNICHLLNNFLHCAAYEYIIFCWVMHEQSIIDEILRRVDTSDCNVKLISLVCDEETLKARLERDVKQGIRNADVLARSMERLILYQYLEMVKVDTSQKTVEEVVRVDYLKGDIDEEAVGNISTRDRTFKNQSKCKRYYVDRFGSPWNCFGVVRFGYGCFV